MANVPIPDCGKGVNFDALPADLELGVWSEGTQNFRFADGIAEKWDGCDLLFSASAAPYYLATYKPGTTRYIVYGDTAMYARSTAGASSTITRYKVEQTISTNTRIGANTAEVTTASAHGLSTNDNVTVYGATESGYNEVNTNITVMSTTVFRYTTTNAIALNATVPGSYVVTDATTNSDFTTAPHRWSGGILSGVLLLNNPTDGLFWWNGDTATDCQKFGVVSYVSDVARVFGNFIVQLAPTMSGTKYRRRVLWSDAAEPGAIPTSFVLTDTNDAGFVDLTGEDGVLVDCVPYGGVNIVYSESGRYAMRLLPGSTEVFSFTRLPGNDGLAAMNCAVNTPRGQVFLSSALDVRIHQGAESSSIANGRIRSAIALLARTYYFDGIFLCANPRKNEVWVVFDVGGSGACLIYAWNWVSDTWSFYAPGSSDGASAACTGLYPTSDNYTTEDEDVLIIGATSNSKVGICGGELDAATGGDWFSSTITGTLARVGMHLGDYEAFKTADGLMLNVDAAAAVTATVQLGSSKTADGTVTYTSGGTFTQGTSKFVDQRATSGPFLAAKITASAFPFRVRSMLMRVSGGGTR